MPQHYCNRAGNAVTADQALDAAGNLRNGFGMRVPLQIFRWQAPHQTQYRDPQGRKQAPRTRKGGETPPPQQVCAASPTAGACFGRSAHAGGADGGRSLEGRDEMLRQRYCDGRAEVDKARSEMIGHGIRRDAGPPGAYPYSAAAEGGGCTINGEDGTLVKQGNYLVCKPRRQERCARATTAAPISALSPTSKCLQHGFPH